MQISAGADHAVLLRSDGRVVAFGSKLGFAFKVQCRGLTISRT